jgi:hypothetical protein
VTITVSSASAEPRQWWFRHCVNRRPGPVDSWPAVTPNPRKAAEGFRLRVLVLDET